MEAIWKKQYSLTAITAPDQFKTYEQLNARLKMVLGQKSPSRPRYDEETAGEDNDRGSYTPDFSSRSQQSELPQSLQSELSNLGSGGFNDPDITVSNSSEEDDALSYFQRLAEE